MKMVNLTTAQITGIVSLALIISGAVVVEVLEKSYYCEPEDNVKECLRVSDSGITCYYLLAGNITKGDRCTGGVWELLDLIEEDVVETIVKVSANGKEWSCVTIDGFVNPYSKCTSGIFEGYLGEFI